MIFYILFHSFAVIAFVFLFIIRGIYQRDVLTIAVSLFGMTTNFWFCMKAIELKMRDKIFQKNQTTNEHTTTYQNGAILDVIDNVLDYDEENKMLEEIKDIHTRQKDNVDNWKNKPKNKFKFIYES